jgi:hypothetical protein
VMELNRSLLSMDTAFTLLSSPPSRFAAWTNFTGPIPGCNSSDPANEQHAAQLLQVLGRALERRFMAQQLSLPCKCCPQGPVTLFDFK